MDVQNNVVEIDNTTKTMTTKEMAEALSVSRQTISRSAKKLFPQNVKNGSKARYDKSQAFAIACDVRPSQPSHTHEKVEKVEKVGYAKLAETIARAVILAIREIMPIQQIIQPPAPAQIAAPTISDRDKYRRAINAAARRTGRTQQELYGMVASEIYYRCHVNVSLKAKNRGMSLIDVIEAEGLLADAILIADEL